MKRKTKKPKPSLIAIILVVSFIVMVGTLTDYNLIYVVVAGAIGGALGKFIEDKLKK